MDALVGSGNIAQAQMWTAAVDALPPSPLRSSVLGYLSTASGTERQRADQLEMAWRTSNPRHDPSAAAPGRAALRPARGGVLGRPDDHHLGGTGHGTYAAGNAPPTLNRRPFTDWACTPRARVSEAEASYHRAFEHAAENAQKQRVQMGAGWLALRLDNVETALVNFESAAPTEYRGGSMRISLWAEAWLARTHLVLGNWDAAAATVARASVRLETSRMPLIRPLLYWTAAELWSMRGDWERARYYVSQAAVQPGTYRAMQVPASLARARFHEARADYEGALAVLQPLTELDPWTEHRVSFWPWQDTYVNALVMTDQLDAADSFLTAFECVPREREIPVGPGAHGLGEGTARWLRRETRTPPGNILRRRWATSGGSTGRTCGHGLVLPTAKACAGPASDAWPQPYCVPPVTCTTRWGRPRTWNAATGSSRRRASTSATYPDPADPVLTAVRDHHLQLTAQERAVAELVAGGATNKEAARALFLAEKTVQYHLTRLYRKLGIRSRSRVRGRVPGQGLTRNALLAARGRIFTWRWRLFDVRGVFGERHHRDLHVGEQRQVLQDVVQFVVRIDVEDRVVGVFAHHPPDFRPLAGALQLLE